MTRDRKAKAGPKAQDSEDVKGVNKWQSRTNQACAPYCLVPQKGLPKYHSVIRHLIYKV